MLQPLEWDEDEALTRKRVPEPIAERVRHFHPRITIIGMPAVAITRPAEPAERRPTKTQRMKVQPSEAAEPGAEPSIPEDPPTKPGLDWEDHEAVTERCTPFYDEPSVDTEEDPSWEHEDEVTAPHDIPECETAQAAPKVELQLTQLEGAPLGRPQVPSVPPVALDAAPAGRARESGWSKLSAVSSALALAAVVATAALLWVPRTGGLRIELDGVEQRKAEIYVDGQKRCDVDPCVVSDLQPGTRSIKVVTPGGAVEADGTVEPGQTTVVSVDMPPAHGLRAHARHEGVRVWIDGKDRGTLPIELVDLAPGTHKVRFEAGERFAPLMRTVEIPEGRIVDLGEIALDIVKVRLTIELGTTDTRVQLVDPDGKVSTVPGPFPTSIDVVPGRYRVVGSKPGYEPHADAVLLGREPTHTVRLALAPLRKRAASSKSVEELSDILSSVDSAEVDGPATRGADEGATDDSSPYEPEPAPEE
jgi:serine/threonine-protein kinase